MRVRRLLVHKKEIRHLNEERKLKGLTLIPLEMYFKGSHVKLHIGLCKGKKLYDKREDMATRDAKRDIDRAMKERFR